MPKEATRADKLAKSFLERAREISVEIEPIKVLKARAYNILDANFLIRAGTLGKNNRYFFGLNYIHAEEIANLDNPFFVFVCNSIDQVIILPASELINRLPSISHDRNGEYKIVFDANLNLILNGRNNKVNCSPYINAWHLISNPPKIQGVKSTVEESVHTVVQGRLIEIGNVRGFQTYCPNKSKHFNSKLLSAFASLRVCPELQFSEYSLLRQIDVLWFREKGQNYIPECAFEVEISTGTWSGVGRLATLIDYANTRLFVISEEERKFQQVMSTFSEYSLRYKHIQPHLIGELYAAELGLQELRQEIGL
ncbi:MAG: hypothetical protein KKC71_02670 [Chloroflexi bacterium]|nr:hypothetical protein [Chloroflexota bacterium]